MVECGMAFAACRSVLTEDGCTSGVRVPNEALV